MASLENQILIFETSAASVQDGDLALRSLEGTEVLSRHSVFRLELECSLEGGLAPATVREMLDARARVSFGPDGVQQIAGILSSLSMTSIAPDGRWAQYQAELVPRLFLLSMTRRSRAFNEMSIPEITERVLGEYGWSGGTDYELRLTGSYSPREYVVQYEETDLAFLERWWERLGIFYTFEHLDGVDKLVLIDANSETVEAADNFDCKYTGQADPGTQGLVSTIIRQDRMMPRQVHVREYNWRTPASLPVGDADVDPDHGRGMQAHYGEHFADDGEGAERARIIAEEWNAQRTLYTMDSANHDFSAGMRFQVSGAPTGDLDIEYLITSVYHRASQAAAGGGAGGGSYLNAIEAIAADVPYRPPRRNPWPKVEGVMHARIDAESVSTATPIDDVGRYKVVVPFDLYTEFGGKASRWVRKAQPYSGPQYGMHFPLHVGAEVLLAHIGGDPDRPIIVGAVPNAATGTPVHATYSTRAAIRTASGIIMDFEDDA